MNKCSWIFQEHNPRADDIYKAKLLYALQTETLARPRGKKPRTEIGSAENFCDSSFSYKLKNFHAWAWEGMSYFERIHFHISSIEIGRILVWLWMKFRSDAGWIRLSFEWLWITHGLKIWKPVRTPICEKRIHPDL